VCLDHFRVHLVANIFEIRDDDLLPGSIGISVQLVLAVDADACIDLHGFGKPSSRDCATITFIKAFDVEMTISELLLVY
jgi:hypothetical protein